MTVITGVPTLKLKKNEDRRLRAGHLWVYSNEVDTKYTSLKDFAAGEAVIVEDSRGHKLGSATVNPHSLICARLVSRDVDQRLGKSLIKHRLNVALALRDRLFAKPYYRLVYGESDWLPGLVVDRYGDVLVVQITSAGMERVKDELIATLEKVLRPKVIILRNDTAMREQEGLDQYVETVVGSAPLDIQLEENGVAFEIPALGGQKTGWFYDHRTSRARLPQLVKGKRVLDVFSYLGGWGVQAAVAGAADVLCVESSAKAVEYIHRNAQLNNVTDLVASLQGDAFEGLKQLREAREKFDIVIVDPPAFIKRKKDSKQGESAYRRINQQAMQLLNKDSVLISASCSQHFTREQLLSVLHKAGRHLDRQLQVFDQGHQGPDHPIHPFIRETEYLHTFFTRVLPA